MRGFEIYAYKSMTYGRQAGGNVQVSIARVQVLIGNVHVLIGGCPEADRGEGRYPQGAIPLAERRQKWRMKHNVQLLIGQKTGSEKARRAKCPGFDRFGR